MGCSAFFLLIAAAGLAMFAIGPDGVLRPAVLGLSGIVGFAGTMFGLIWLFRRP